MPAMTCPNCGASVPPQIAQITMVTCGSCDTTLYLQDDRLLTAGQSGEMHDAPALIHLGETVTLGHARITALGHARFSYGRGWWDEFWCIDARDRGCWLSIDEGDLVLQYPLPADDWPRVERDPPVGLRFKYRGYDARVIETDRAECIGLRGSFGERLSVGDTYSFVNVQTDDGDLLSGEFWAGGESWFLGSWFDPFDIAGHPS
ncbi:DUF4178 domain-containing protein [Lutimaribacter sp. EGI FJ00015]|uniref:DUF4178 domain-containing protein n=1 Tax=Lutimaribacter degradans TaxID=2945989 RepID=A0ACC5ZY20_9RHOB|nr:DUF4178 domain-containing protein [Lutimaribacter sp. EGI FJ00013]MCM2563239.1 DUF4178 domain-containing protein [Lutimaribacter sp. EGI FJ00013]MCO0614438.1 DUF4178 domain-containing protein [Lutimaribacter sp. EGI FJ00015]MCO0635961.1 DUF4178 domain-containing protein [Lutimaribacter sp. EGI FJ00014]